MVAEGQFWNYGLRTPIIHSILLPQGFRGPGFCGRQKGTDLLNPIYRSKVPVFVYRVPHSSRWS